MTSLERISEYMIALGPVRQIRALRYLDEPVAGFKWEPSVDRAEETRRSFI